jgi:site-specific recombinase XerD
MILMTYRHGMRREEVCQLRLSDIKNGELNIERLKGSKRTVQPLMPHRGQPLLDEVKGLRMWLVERPKDSGDALFPSEKGSCMSGRHFARLYRRYVLMAGVNESKANAHTLKHTIANHLIRAGFNVAEVQTRLGHSQISSTMKYISLNDAEVAEKAHNVMMSMF